MFATVLANAQVGTKNNKNVTKESYVVKTVSVKSANSLTFEATAYALKGIMANGQKVCRGAIAADPRVLPIGTIVQIDGMGMFTVKDTGGAIKGNRIDIWMSSVSESLKFGRRHVILKIISKPIKKIKKCKL